MCYIRETFKIQLFSCVFLQSHFFVNHRLIYDYSISIVVLSAFYQPKLLIRRSNQNYYLYLPQKCPVITASSLYWFLWSAMLCYIIGSWRLYTTGKMFLNKISRLQLDLRPLWASKRMKFKWDIDENYLKNYV